MTELVMVVLVVIGVWLILKRVKQRMDLNYNYRQQAIYEQACKIIFQKAEETDTPREDTMILLNAAAETYNESLRGKYASQLEVPPFQIMRQTDEIGKHSAGRQTDPQGEESEGETESRPTRQRMDSSGQS